MVTALKAGCVVSKQVARKPSTVATSCHNNPPTPSLPLSLFILPLPLPLGLFSLVPFPLLRAFFSTPNEGKLDTKNKSSQKFTGVFRAREHAQGFFFRRRNGWRTRGKKGEKRRGRREGGRREGGEGGKPKRQGIGEGRMKKR